MDIDWVQVWSILPIGFICFASVMPTKLSDKIYMGAAMLILFGPMVLRIWKII